MTSARKTQRHLMPPYEGRAVLYQAHKSVLRLVDRKAPDKGGSCVAIRIGHRYFLATAAHVLRDKQEVEIVLANAMANLTEGICATACDRECDVGFLEVDPRQAEPLSELFVPESRLLTTLDQQHGWRVIVNGYPAAYISPIGQCAVTSEDSIQLYACSAFAFVSITIPTRKWPNRALSRRTVYGRDIFVRYNPDPEHQSMSPSTAGSPTQSVAEEAPPLAGVSGGGIWVPETDDKADIWQPSVRLVGIEVSYTRGEKWIRGTLIDKWVDLVAGHYPDLKDPISSIRHNTLQCPDEIRA